MRGRAGPDPANRSETVASYDLPELTLTRIRKVYGLLVAVNDVSFSVRPGEFLTILGPSGSGKTTLLHMIAGFLFPDAGTIGYRGTSITYMPAHLRNMGMVFQNYALFPHMTVKDNLAFPLRMRRASKGDIARRVHDALELVGLSGRGSHLPSQLSGGQQQRVAVARALVYQPSLLLMDEPLGALDKSLRERLQVEIKAIQRATGVTILYVTHDQQEALSMSDRIAVMSGGKLSAIGSVQDIYERPPDRFVAQAVGECNFLSGRVSGLDERFLSIKLSNGASIQALRSRAAPAISTGTDVEVCIRPESLVCAEPTPNHDDPPDGRFEAVQAVVAEVIYLGDAIKHELVLNQSDARTGLSAKALRTSATKAVPRGTEVIARWAIEEAWIVPRRDAD